MKKIVLLFFILLNVVAYSQAKSPVFSKSQKDSIKAIISDSLDNFRLQVDTILTGTATISLSADSVIVTHGLGSAPSIANINIAPQEDISGFDYWIESITSTTFKIKIGTTGYDALTEPISFSWQIFNADVSTYSTGLTQAQKDSIQSFVSDINKIKNITDFEGVYSDSSNSSTNGAAITSALEWCSENGYATYFPAGKYVYEGYSLKVFPNNVIIGAPNKTIWYPVPNSSGYTHAMTYNDADWVVDSTQNNLYIEGITIIGIYDFGDGWAGGAGGFALSGKSSPNIMFNKVVFNNCKVMGVKSEGMKIYRAKIGIISNSYVQDCPFTAFTMGNDNNYLLNNYSERTFTGIEIYANNFWDDTQISTSIISGNTIKPDSSYGIRCYGGGNTKIINNNLIRKEGKSSVEGNGIQIATFTGGIDLTTNSYEIYNNSIANFYIGINNITTDIRARITSLSITNNKIYNLYSSAIALSDTTSDNYLRKVLIKNNEIFNWNSAGINSDNAKGISINNIDSVVISDNRMFKETSGYKYPLQLINTVGAQIYSNNFTMAEKSYLQIDTVSSGYFVFNNIGLNSSSGGIRKYQTSPVTYEQQIWETQIDGFKSNGGNVLSLNSDGHFVLDEVESDINASDLTAGQIALYLKDNKLKLAYLQDSGLRVKALDLFTDDSVFITQDTLGAELLSNASFESLTSGTPDDNITDNFEYWSEQANEGILEQVSGGKFSYCLGITNVSGEAFGQNYLYKTVTGFSESSNYRFIFWTKGDGTNAGSYRIRDNDNATDIIANTSTSVTSAEWTQLTIDFETPAGCENVVIYFYSSGVEGSSVYFDTLSMREIQ